MATIPSSSIRWLIAAGQMAGLNMGEIMQEANIDPSVIADQEGQLPEQQATLLRAKVLSKIQDEAFALRTGENIPIGELGVVDYICVSSLDVKNAMENLDRYFRLVAHHYFRLTFSIQNGDGILHYGKSVNSSSSLNWFEQQSTEFTFAVTLTRIRQATNVNVIPKSVHFCHPRPQYAIEYERLFQSSVYFNELVNSLVLPRECLDLRPIQHDTRLHQMLRTFADSTLNTLPPTSGVTSEVLQALKQELQGGEASIASVAKIVHMSERTLHRRLKEEGTSFAELRDKLRCEMAQSLLSDQSITIADVSYLLGFSQPSAFHRAFKRWTGSAPQLYRER